MSYIEYLKAKEKSHPSTNTTDFAQALTSYGKIKCDMCGEVCDINDTRTETCIVTEPSTGNRRYYHFCYDCLHRKMDVDDVHGTYTDAEVKQWRLKYKDIKTRKPINAYEDMCLNCFIGTNNIQMFKYEGWNNGSIPTWDYRDTHPAFITISEGIDRESSSDTEIAEFHYVFQLHRSDEDLMTHDFRLCKGNGSMLCENCRFKKEGD